jgi:D-alanine-D-alanine ligase
VWVRFIYHEEHCMSDLERVVVLAGGLSHEREVSLRSGRRALEALREVGADAELRDVDERLVAELAASPPQVVLPLLHGAMGEDGSVRDILSLLGIPYVGAPPSACRVAFNKPPAKHLVSGAGADTPASVVFPRMTFRDLGAAPILTAAVAALGLPLIVKPTNSGSALGCSIVHEPEELPSAMVNAYAYGDVALLERYISGVEVAVPVIDTGEGPRVLPAVEIVPNSELYDYQARYTAGETTFFTPARLDPEAADAAAQLALLAHRALGLRDLSRTDMIVDPSGRPWFLEANVAPGMTETSLFPQSVAAAGLDFGVVLRDLLQQAVDRGPDPVG